MSMPVFLRIVQSVRFVGRRVLLPRRFSSQFFLLEFNVFIFMNFE